MGVATGIGSMSTTTDAIYTHKKFKRAAVEAWESKDIKNNFVPERNEPSNFSDGRVKQSCDLKASLRPVVSINTRTVSCSDDDTLVNKSVKKNDFQTVLTCTTCGFVNSDEGVFQSHKCIRQDDDKVTFCNRCQQNFRHHTWYLNHICNFTEFSSGSRTPTPSNSSNCNTADLLGVTGAQRFIYNRSLSYPYNVKNNGSESKSIQEGDSGSSPVQVFRQIYKPKFRAQYSFSDERSKGQAALHNQISNSQVHRNNKSTQDFIFFSSVSNIPSTYQVPTASYVISPSNQETSFSSSSHSGNHGKLPVSSPLDLPNSDIYPLQKGVISQCSSLSKGIRGIMSPSPELVNQHITNLIVQNQAIVETHNPLWSMKYRRQSSTGSLTENDNPGTKGRRCSVSEVSKGSKRNHSVHNFSQEPSTENLSDSINSSLLQSLPKSYHSPSASSRASRPNISVSMPTSSIASVTKNVDGHRADLLYTECNTNSHPVNSSGIQSESLDLSRNSSKRSDSKLVVFHSEAKDHHKCFSVSQSLNLNYDNQHLLETLKIPEGRNIAEQEIALDLQKKQTVMLEYERSSSRESSFSEPGYKHYHEDEPKMIRGLSVSPKLQQLENIYLTSPPLKRRKLSNTDFSTHEKPMFSPLYPQNGKITTKSDYGMTSLDDLNKPKSKSNHIYGGEVKICDGKEYKTLKIDSVKNDSPSLDLCIASKHLAEGSEQKEPLLPTSVVVTIAKCGLNSGGTMVKIQNKGSYSNRKLSLSTSDTSVLNNTASTSGKTEPVSDEYLHSPVGLPVSPANIYPSLLHYSEFQPETPGALPALSASSIGKPGLSLHLLKSSVSSASLLPSGTLLLPSGASLLSAGTTLLPSGTSLLPSGTSLLPTGLTLHSQTGLRTANSNCVFREQSATKLKDNSAFLHTKFPQYPAIISVGNEQVPYVPGIPGPYSQSSLVIRYPSKHTELLQSPQSFDKSSNSLHEQSESVHVNHPKYSVTRTLLSSLNDDNTEDADMHGANKHSKPTDECKQMDTADCTSEVSLVQSQKEATSIQVIAKECKPRIKKDFIKVPLTKEYIQQPMKDIIIGPTQEIFGSNVILVSKTPEIRIQPPPITVVDLKPQEETDDDQRTMKSEEKSHLKEIQPTFLLPRQRPNTLLIKPQSFNQKSSLALIGSTLVSPDTPRPKKSCAQLFLNGSAYTYLNLKVSTKTFFCCIYRPQPMYVIQSPNQKLSMYSNWQIRKTDDPLGLNLSPAEAMSLHISNFYYDKAYTIAKPKTVQLNVTPSSYWTQNKIENDMHGTIVSKLRCKDNEKDMSVTLTDSKSNINKVENVRKVSENGDVQNKSSKRVRIFEGGFKTNEDYIYVRGRGRGRYVCETCGIRCKKPSMLKKHIRTHTDFRPYACKHCSFSFKTKGNLTKHLKSKAHFKRCTEMGIDPVPIAVDESHVSQEALQLQGITEGDVGKENPQSVEDCEDEDDDEGDEEDDDDEEGDDDDEEFDEDEEITGSSQVQSSAYIFGLGDTNAVGISSHSPSLTSAINSCDKTESVPQNLPLIADDNGPMDLSMRRHTVIAENSIYREPSNQEHDNQLSPNYLPLNKKLIESIIKSPCPPNCPSSVGNIAQLLKEYPLGSVYQVSSTPIREQPSEILSPVTDSSILLKSIYSTTSSLDKRRLNSDYPMTTESSCGNMLQTYLKEMAVLDSARKRQQYLQAPLSPHQFHNSLMTNTKNVVNADAADLTEVSKSKNAFTGHTVLTGAGVHTKSVIIVSAVNGAKTDVSLVLSAADVKNQPPTTSYTSVTNSAPSTGSDRLTLIESPAPDQSALASITCDSKEQEDGIVVSKDLMVQINSSRQNGTPPPSSSPSSSPTYIMAGNVSASGSYIASRNIGSSSVNKATRNGASNISSSLHANVSNSMPTPPANLTVVNTCEGDSKPAFIAPSGVIPSSNTRMGSDDGKCRCSICHKDFTRQSQLRLHMNIHFIERPHRCDSCGVSFRTNGHLQKHKRSVSHFNKVNMNMTFGTPSTENPRPFKCHDCKIAFRIHGHLAKHLRSKLHIMKLECVGKLPFGTYAEIERSGASLNEIDTSDCENSLQSLQVMASKLYEREPSKLLAWQNQQQSQQQKGKHESRQSRIRTISSSSSNSEEYLLLDEQDAGAAVSRSNEDEDSGEDEVTEDLSHGIPSSTNQSSQSNCEGAGQLSEKSPPPPVTTSSSSVMPPCEVGSGATAGLLGCPQCHQKFMDVKHFKAHYYKEHENAVKTEEDEV